jgi:hypothetical protein
MGWNRLRAANREFPLKEQVRKWEQDEMQKIERERQELFGSGQGSHLDHLSRKVGTQEDHDGISELNQAVEGDRDAKLLGVDQNVQNDVQNGSQANRVTLGTGEAQSELMSANKMFTCGVAPHLEETPGQPGGAQVSPGLSWS